MKEQKINKITKTSPGKNGAVDIRRFVIPAILFFAGIAFVFAGIYRGEMEIVLRKAINICLECIGIG